jgi:4-amino-4-deoxy-L-arabinose transferase-like glycosyltransferase
VNPERRKKKKFLLLCLASLFLVLFLRLISLNWSPLFDTTEARYAGIAQEILLQNDWITLKMPALHEPFLAKPPFSFWFIAFCYKLFNASNEFTARLPNFIASVLVLIFTYLIARKFYDKRTALISPLILYSSIWFFIQAGTVDLDMWVCFTTTAGLWTYLNIEKNRKEFWKRSFWELIFGLIFGFGMLNRGPLSLVLILGSLFLYAVWTKKLKDLIFTNWFLVFGIGFLVAYPWYSAAQAQNHDFYKYFFVEEHWNRYLKPKFADRYGNEHNEPKGMSWVFTIGAFMPWSLVLFPFFRENFKNIIDQESKEFKSILFGFSGGEQEYRSKGMSWIFDLAGLMPYSLIFLPFFPKNVEKLMNRKSRQFNSLAFLLSWFIFTPLFFTFAKSILMTYILSSLPALSIICARTISLFLHKTKSVKEVEIPNKPKNLLFELAFNLENNIPCMVIITLFIGAGLFIYSNSSPYIISAITQGISIIGFFILISLLIYIYNTAQINKRKYLFLLIGFLGIPILMSYWYGALSKSVSEYKSAKQIILDMKGKVKDFKDYNILFFHDNAPYSWYFYLQAPLIKQVLTNKQNNFEKNYKQLHEFSDFVYKPDSDQKVLMIVQEDNLKELRDLYPNIYSSGLISKAGRYSVYKVV